MILPEFPVHNRDACRPLDMAHFLHPTITDMYYGCAALMHWGINKSTDAILASVKSIYYDNTGSEGEGPLGPDDLNAENGEEEGHPSQPKEKMLQPQGDRIKDSGNQNRTASTRCKMDKTMDLLMIISEWNRWQQAGDEEAQPVTEDHSPQNSRDKVMLWLQGH
jgi:hypothetical protein